MAYPKEPERQPFLRIPAATTGLIVVLVAAYVAAAFVSPTLSSAIIANYAFFPARYSHAFLVAHSMDPGTAWDRAVPFVSYIFIHANLAHLAVNCAFLLPFGSVVERRFGVLVYYVFFLVCGIGGAVGHLVTHWGSPEYAIGASAAISGLVAAAFRIVAPLEAGEVQTFSDAVNGEARMQRPLAPLASPRLATWSLMFIAINVVLGRQFGFGPDAQLVAWQAHIGGFLTGLVLADIFDRAARMLRAR
ncbi:MAG TPA: rhomboid family intramembrane serine protease [Rhizomicrobium sp.]|nr:rhomboid family intramembrane serine protease [Rhizomicrobium sp.]